MQRTHLSSLIWLFFGLHHGAQAASPPALQLAQEFLQVTDLNQFWVSEKLDGVRAYWDGKQLMTRRGNPILAPDWFTANFPAEALDGELWIDRGQFERVSSTIRRVVPDDSEWRQINYMVFDLPHSLQYFDQRLLHLQELVSHAGCSWLRLVPQQKYSSQTALSEKHQAVIALGGEGLMLHRGTSLYQARRTSDLQKLKLHQDAEAIVVAHIEGKGQFSGMLGAILVEMDNGVQFKIGSGFNLAQRQNPPAIGSRITFRYRGKTNKGVPRFATFLREWHDL